MEFSHVVHVVKTVRISKVIPSRVVTMSPMSLVTHCAETKQTNKLRVNLKSWPTLPNTLWF